MKEQWASNPSEGGRRRDSESVNKSARVAVEVVYDPSNLEDSGNSLSSSPIAHVRTPWPDFIERNLWIYLFFLTVN